MNEIYFDDLNFELNFQSFLFISEGIIFLVQLMTWNDRGETQRESVRWFRVRMNWAVVGPLMKETTDKMWSTLQSAM